MIDDIDALHGLLVAIMPLAFLLLIMSSALLGRKVTDLEYQRATGLNGVRSIQAQINIRTHGNRIFLALVFLSTTIVALTGVAVEWQQWIARILFSVLLIGYCVSAALDWRDDRRQVRILIEQDLALEEARVQRDPGRESFDEHATRQLRPVATDVRGPAGG